MFRFICITLFATLICSYSSAQNKIAELKFEEAEEAYEKKDYEMAASKIKEVEALIKTTSPHTSYLLIKSQSKIIERDPLKDYGIIENTRELSARFLKDYGNIPEISETERYRDVYKVSEKLKEYPRTRAAFEEEHAKIEANKLIQQQVVERERQAEAKKLQEQQDLIAQQLKEEEIRKLRRVGFFGFRVGLALPSSSDSKELMTYDQWLNSTPFAAPFQDGRVGLNSGFSFGFTGIIGLEGLNKGLNPHIGFGLSIDINQTFLMYDWEDIAKEKSSTSFLFTEATYKPFSITSIGIGPSFTFRPNDSKTYIDAYLRVELSVLGGGNYDLEEAYDDESKTTYTIKTTRYDPSFNLAPTFGFNFRHGSLFLGVDFRTGLIYDLSYTETYNIQSANDSFYDSSEFSNPALDLSYTGLSIGIIF